MDVAIYGEFDPCLALALQDSGIYTSEMPEENYKKTLEHFCRFL